MRKYPLLFKIVTSAVLIIAFIYIISELSEDRKDPYYFYLDTLLQSNGIIYPDINLKLDTSTIYNFSLITVEDRFDSLEQVYKTIHKHSDDIEQFKDIISKPFPLIDECDKFCHFLDLVLSKKKVIVEGISGTGKTTLIDRTARIIAGKTENILKLECVERLEAEYHKIWIGTRNNDKFQAGKLLRFFEVCKQNPEENFIFIIDDIDKIYPSALFGSEVWKELDNPIYDTFIEGYEKEIAIPDNFYMISIMHSDVGNVIEMTSEHFRRLGEIYVLEPNVKTLLMYILTKQEKLNLSYQHIKKLLYVFVKVNEYIQLNYGNGSRLGQWSNLRKQIEPDKFQNFLNEFVVNVNAFKLIKQLILNDLNDIVYSANNNGILLYSSDLSMLYEALVDIGILSELSVAITFTLISGITGWVILNRRRKLLNDYNRKILEAYNDYEAGRISLEDAIGLIIQRKNMLKNMVIEKKIKYEEYIYFSFLIDDTFKRIDSLNDSNKVLSGFDSTFNEFLSDGHIDESEYQILHKFLDSMKPAISLEIYYSLKDKIQQYRNLNK